jgi:hypothetical protein
MAISTIGTNSLSDPIAVNGYTPTASNMQPLIVLLMAASKWRSGVHRSPQVLTTMTPTT